MTDLPAALPPDANEPIHVVIADDHEVVRRGIRSLLDTFTDIEVVGEATTGTEAVAVAIETMPDVVLLDLQMPGGHGIDATRQLAATLPNVAVVVLTMYEDSGSIDAALRAGARGYLLKGAPQVDVVHAIRVASRGHVVLGPEAADRMLERLTGTADHSPVFPELSKREHEVLSLVADGHSNVSIGAMTGLAPKTVANHVSNILTKLQIADRSSAIVTARRAGLGED